MFVNLDWLTHLAVTSLHPNMLFSGLEAQRERLSLDALLGFAGVEAQAKVSQQGGRRNDYSKPGG